MPSAGEGVKRQYPPRCLEAISAATQDRRTSLARVNDGKQHTGAVNTFVIVFIFIALC